MVALNPAEELLEACVQWLWGPLPREAGIPSSGSQLAKGFQNPEFGNLHTCMDRQGQSLCHDRPKVMHSL